MILYTIVQIRDSEADCWAPPQFVPSLGAWMRQIANEVNSGTRDNPIAANPEHFELWQIGEMADDDGKINLFPEKKSMGLASNYIIKRQ